MSGEQQSPQEPRPESSLEQFASMVRANVGADAVRTEGSEPPAEQPAAGSDK